MKDGGIKDGEWRRVRRLTVNEQRLLRRHGRALVSVSGLHALLTMLLWWMGALHLPAPVLWGLLAVLPSPPLPRSPLLLGWCALYW